MGQFLVQFKSIGRPQIVTLMCDSTDRYQDTYYDSHWVEEHIGDLTQYEQWLDAWL